MNLAPQQWLQLKQTTRQALKKIFNIPQSTFTHVVDNKVESDGHTYDDLKAITLEGMKELTHLESDNFFEQFDLIVHMVEDEGSTPVTNEIINKASTEAENATANEPTATTSDAAPVDTGAKEGINPQAPVSEEAVLPVPGGVDEINRGSNEPVPNTGSDDTASVATKDAEVDAKKSKVAKPAK